MMLGFTSSLPLSVPLICPSEDFGNFDVDPLFIVFSVSSILQEIFGHQTSHNRSEQRDNSDIISLFVVLVQVVPFIYHLSTRKVQRDLPVLARGVPELS